MGIDKSVWAKVLVVSAWMAWKKGSAFVCGCGSKAGLDDLISSRRVQSHIYYAHTCIYRGTNMSAEDGMRVIDCTRASVPDVCPTPTSIHVDPTW